MSRLDALVEGIIIASDKQGRNKVRFCENIIRRANLLNEQGFTIHDIIASPNKVSRVDMLKYALQQDFDHSDSKNLVLKTLYRYNKDAVKEYTRQNLLQEIASRPKRDTDLQVNELDKVLENI